MKKLDGKIALITGGSSGIGLATAKRFVAEGAYVFIAGRREAELAEPVRQVGKNLTGVRGDVAKIEDLDRLFAQIEREKGKLDILFANAGITTITPPGQAHRGGLRLRLRYQREGGPVHGAEGASADGGRRLDHLECVHRRQQRIAELECV